MNYKKILSAAAAVIIGITAVTVPGIRNSEKQNETVENSSGASSGITGSDSFGKYVSKMSENKLAQSSDEENYSPFYSMSGIRFDEASSEFVVNTAQNTSCKLRINIYTDNEEGGLFTYFEKDVDADATETRVGVSLSELPEYFTVKAVLTGKIGEELCTPMYYNGFTRTMCEVKNATVNDFEPEYTVNFDDDGSTNFVVLSEETVIAESTDNVNVIKESDYENGVFVFENADEKIKSLSEGEYLYVQSEDNEIIAVSVGSVEINGDTATISDSGESIDDMFDFIKLDAVYTTDASAVNMDNSEFEMTETRSPSNQVCLNFTNNIPVYMAATSAEKKLTVQKNGEEAFTPEHEIGEDGAVSANVSYSYEVEFSFYKHYKEIEVMFTLETEATLAVQVGFESDGHTIKEIKNLKPVSEAIAKIDIPTELPGIVIEWEPKIEASFEGAFKIEKTFINKEGFVYNSKTGYSSISDPGKKTKMTVAAEGKCIIGLRSEVSIVAVHEDILKFTVPIFVGLDIKGKLEKEIGGNTYHLSPSVDEYYIEGCEEDNIHVCPGCIDGTVDFLFEVNVEATVFTKKLLVYHVFEKSIPLGKWHFSFKYGFGLGECPHRAYRISVAVTCLDKDGNSSAGKGDLQVGAATAPLIDGKAAVYCEKSKYEYIIHDEKGAVKKRESFQMENKSHHFNIILNASGDSEVSTSEGEAFEAKPVTYSTEDPVSDNPSDYKTAKMSEGCDTIEAGKLGDNITYIIYENGNMAVFGYGDMNLTPSSSIIHNKEAVKNVVIENTGNGINNLGYGLFNQCENLTSIVIPESVTKIESYAFNGCTSLSKVVYPAVEDENGKIYEPPYDFKNIKQFGMSALGNCKMLSNTIDLSGAELIDNRAFYHCEKISGKLDLSNAEKIGNSAFEECKGITEVITKKAKIIGDLAFSGCSSLEKFTISDNIYGIARAEKADSEYIGVSAFFKCTSLEEIVTPVLHKIPNQPYFFNDIFDSDGNSNVKILKFTKTQETEIPQNIFGNIATYTEITIPRNINTIGMFNFKSCKNLKDVYFGGSELEWNKVDIKENNDALLNAEIHFAIATIGPEGEFNPEEAEKLRGCGDVNGNGVTDITDLSYLALYLIKDIDFNETALVYADIDQDGEVKLTDLATLRMQLSHR